MRLGQRKEDRVPDSAGHQILVGETLWSIRSQEEALSDAGQSLASDEFAALMGRLVAVPSGTVPPAAG